MIKIAICDDDVTALNYLKEKISEYYHDNCQVFTYNNGKSLLLDTQSYIFDVLFLDIDMPVMDGMKLAEVIRESNQHVKIIFVTNKDGLVYESIRYMPFRYIRKSHIDEELKEAVTELKKSLSNDSRTGLFSTSSGDICIKFIDIFYTEIYNHTLTIHIEDKSLTICRTMDDFEKEVGNLGFIRTHKSYLVNYRYIRSFSGNNVILDNGTAIPVSKNRVKEVKLKYQILSRTR